MRKDELKQRTKSFALQVINLVNALLDGRSSEVIDRQADECLYWMELLGEAQLAQPEKLQPLMTEADGLVAITVASIRTAKANKK